jgi:putative ABC transport system permease protein
MKLWHRREARKDPARRERSLDRELRDYLDLEAEDQLQHGLPPGQARYAAQRALGNTTLVKEDTRAMWRWAWLQPLWQDLRYGVRLLLKTPGFTAVAVLTLALGIGANTAIFSLVEGLMLKPLPYHRPDSLVVPATIFQRMKTDRGPDSYSDILDWKAQTGLFDGVATFNTGYADVTGAEEPERIRALSVDQDYFRVMATPPAAGRTFLPEEHHLGAGRAVVLTWRLWMRRFGGDSKLLGSPIQLGGVPYTVIGVMPKDSTWPEDAELFRPLITSGVDPATMASMMRRDNHMFRAVARLQPGVSLEQAQARLTALGARVAQENTNRAGTNWKLHPLTAWVIGPTLRQTLLVLMGAVGFVLLIACVNVANLLLARGAARAREVAIRCALGAGWKRLAGQFLVETGSLAAAGGVAGVCLGYWGLRGLIHFAPADVPRLDQVHIDSGALAFTAALCFLTAVVSGLVPALHAARLAPVAAFRQMGRGFSEGLRTGRLRNILVVSELALAIVLLAGAGLLIRSFAQLRQVNPGFATANLITMQIGLPRSRYAGPPEVLAGFDRIAAGIRRIPGVIAASATSSLPLDGGGSYLGRVFLNEGQPEPPATRDTQASWSVIQPGYFATMRVPMVQGRPFTDRDTRSATPVIIVSQAMARQMFPNQSPLGRRIRSWRDENLYREIVGVVGDLRYDGLAEDIGNNVYIPHAQDTWNAMMLTIRTHGDPNPLLGSIRAEVWSVDKKLSISEVKTMEQILDTQLARPRFSMFLLGLFAATALLLAAIGIYGVMSYSVAQRTREIGIRMALGALRGDVLRIVARRAAILAGVGTVAGIVGALAATRLLRTLLFGVDPADARTFVAVSAVLILVALAASYIPARRATKVDPTITLRYE